MSGFSDRLQRELRRLYINVMIAQKRWLAADQPIDDEAVMQWARSMPWGFWENRYMNGSIEIDEFEQLLDLSLM